MSEVLSLFPILVLIYLLQGIAAAPAATTVFLLSSRLHGRLLRHSWRLGPSHLRQFLLHPLFPTRCAVYSDLYPFAFLAAPSGELLGLEFVASAESTPSRVLFDTQPRFSRLEKELLVDGTAVANFHSTAAAERIAALLQELQSRPVPKRRPFLDRELRRALNSQAIQARLQLFGSSTVFLASLCHALFLYLFVMAPAAVLFLGLSRIWPGLLVTVVLCCLFILWAFRRARKKLYPSPFPDSLQQLLPIALSPFAAVRALDPLGADLLEEFHPLAIAHSILSENDFLTYAESLLRRTRFLSHDPILLDAFSLFLSSHKLDASRFLRAPEPDGPASRSFCPVCLTQFVIDHGTCPDCGDVPLHSFANEKNSASDSA